MLQLLMLYSYIMRSYTTGFPMLYSLGVKLLQWFIYLYFFIYLLLVIALIRFSRKTNQTIYMSSLHIACHNNFRFFFPRNHIIAYFYALITITNFDIWYVLVRTVNWTWTLQWGAESFAAFIYIVWVGWRGDWLTFHLATIIDIFITITNV